MMLFSQSVSSAASSAREFLERAFPPPALFVPPSVGIDVSDASIKWVGLERGVRELHVGTHGMMGVQRGVIDHGVVRDSRALAEVLAMVRKAVDPIVHAHAALPEESGYVFSMNVPAMADREEIMHRIEFELEDHVPMSAALATYDFDVLRVADDGTGMEIAVTAFPRDIPESYANVFADAGFELLSLEIESRSIGRAITPSGDHTTVLAIDFGRDRSGLSVLQGGIPIFTSTVEVGGETATRALMEQLSMSEAEATAFKNEEGIFSKNQKGAEAVLGAVATLAEEVDRIRRYWDAKRIDGNVTSSPIARIVLVGGASNLHGLAEYLSGKARTEAIMPNVWQHVSSFDSFIPPIDRRNSFGYTTAIGLALRDVL